MSPQDIKKLLGGYATGTLTAEEQQALFAAALEDQELFDALAREQSVRDLLRDPASAGGVAQRIGCPGEPVWFLAMAAPSGGRRLGDSMRRRDCDDRGMAGDAGPTHVATGPAYCRATEERTAHRRATCASPSAGQPAGVRKACQGPEAIYTARHAGAGATAGRWP